LLISCQGSFLYHPSRVLDNNPESINLSYESVDFNASDGTNLHGWYIPAEKHRGVVLFCHGNGGNISHRLDTIKVLNELKLSVFIFDYRGYGRSSGTPTEKGTYKDAMAAWKYLREAKAVPSEKIIVHGRSLGGAIAVWLASETNPAALIVESSFTSTVDVARTMNLVRHFSGIITYKYPAIDYIKKVKCPIMVIHSRDDRLIVYSLGRKLYDAAPGNPGFLEIKGGHNTGFIESYDVYKNGLDMFLSGININ
jgi:pimeloyl-ACP methyl ester carboxylesterase